MLKLLLFTSHGLSISYKLQRKTFHVLSDLYHQRIIKFYYSLTYIKKSIIYRFISPIHRNKREKNNKNAELFDRKWLIKRFHKKVSGKKSRNLINAERTGYYSIPSGCSFNLLRINTLTFLCHEVSIINSNKYIV